MAKAEFHYPLKCLTGTVEKDSKVYYRKNRVTGLIHAVHLSHPYRGAASPAQKACREHFRRVMALVSERLRDPQTNAAVRKEYLSQHEVGTLVGFAYRKWKGEIA